VIAELALLAALAVPPSPAFDHSHRALGAVLSAHVREGVVDYPALKQDGSALARYLGTLEGVTRDQLAAFTRDQRLAFWINAYNAYTLKLVLDHYPVESIRKIGRFWESPFKIRFIPLEKIRGERISLDVIEHEVLRKAFQDPRIHAAIACAARSCPLLRDRAYTALAIDSELDQAMKGFLADPSKNRWDPATRTLGLSSIFDWFRQDFEKDGPLAGFVARYLDLPPGGEPRIQFLDYDWSLNGR